VNARRLLPLAHETLVFDNSGREPALMFEMRFGRVLSKIDKMPVWAQSLVD
jgi:hypothetical protein